MPETTARARLAWLVCVLMLSPVAVAAVIAAAEAPDGLGLVAENNPDGRVRLSWTWMDDERVDHYQVYWSTREFDTVEGMEPGSTEMGSTYLVLGLEDGVRHHFAVAAVDANGTVLAEDHVDAVPKLPDLKEVNYWNLMASLVAATAVFLLVLVRIPMWRRMSQGGEGPGD